MRVDVLIERESELAVLGEVVEAAVARARRRGADRGGGRHRQDAACWGWRAPARWRPERASCTPPPTRSRRACRSRPRASCSPGRRAASRPTGRRGSGVLALEAALSDPSGPGSRSDEVVHALWWLIVELADERPLALFLDDAQWADELTLRLLRLAARRARRAAARARRRRPAGGSGSCGTLVLAAERAFVRLEPAPLSVAGTARLVEAVLGRPGSVGLVARARAVTRGNPLYLSELLQAARVRGVDPMSDGFVDDGAPPQLVRLVGDRLGRSSPAATALARAVAVLGADAEPGRARALAGLDATEAIAAEEELRDERVLDAGRVRASPIRWSPRRRARGSARRHAAELHARAAALLADDGVDDQRVAEHLVRAPPRGDAEVVATLRRAAEAARRARRPDRPRRGCSSAHWPSRLPPQLVDAVDFERGRSLLDAGDEDGARVLARVAQRAPDVSLRVDAARHLARRFGLRRPRRRSRARSCAASWRRCRTPIARCGSSCWSSSRSSATPTSRLTRRRRG